MRTASWVPSTRIHTTVETVFVQRCKQTTKRPSSQHGGGAKVSVTAAHRAFIHVPPYTAAAMERLSAMNMARAERC